MGSLGAYLDYLLGFKYAHKGCIFGPFFSNMHSLGAYLDYLLGFKYAHKGCIFGPFFFKYALLRCIFEPNTHLLGVYFDYLLGFKYPPWCPFAPLFFNVYVHLPMSVDE